MNLGNESFVVKTKSYLNVKAIFLCVFVGAINSFFYDDVAIMLALCAVEIACLVWCLLRREYISYIAYYTVFLCFSMESLGSDGVAGSDSFYGFKNFHVGGLNLAVWVLIPLVVVSLYKTSYLFSNIGSLHKKILGGLVFFTFTCGIMGLITYLVDDNGFSSQSGSMRVLIGCYYSYVLPLLEILAVSFCVVFQKSKISKLKEYLYSIIVATAVVYILCLVFKNYGRIGGLESLQVSEVYFLLVCSLCLLCYGDFNFQSKVVLGVSGVVILVLSLAYNASGKIVIIAVLIPIIMVIIILKQGKAVKTVLMLFVGCLVLFCLLSFLFPLLIGKSMLLSIKYEQAMKMLSFSSDNWFDNIPSSPRMRIAEFVEIAVEYIHKPWFAFLGKGFGGTVVDRLRIFTDVDEFAFSRWELDLGAYYSMHESVNNFFLVGGVFGLYTIISLTSKTFRYVHLSPWLVFGFVWILLFYNYHSTIGIYGIVSLVVGLEDVHEHDLNTIKLEVEEKHRCR